MTTLVVTNRPTAAHRTSTLGPVSPPARRPQGGAPTSVPTCSGPGQTSGRSCGGTAGGNARQGRPR